MDQQTATQINEAITEPAPVIGFPVTNEVQLLRGVYDPATNTWHDRAIVKEMTGADEEYLANLEARKKDLSFTDYIDALFARTVQSIGTLDASQHANAIDKLILADRDLLFLGIVKATHGKTRELRNLICPHCEAKNDVMIDLDEDFPSRTVEGFDPKETRSVQLRRGVVDVRLPNGEDIRATSKASNNAEFQSILIARCVVLDSDDATPFEDKLEWSKQLNVGDRNKLGDAILGIEIGPDLGGVKAHCSECSEEMNIPINWVGLLLS